MKNKFSLLLAFVILGSFLNAQTFTGTTGAITDNNTTYDVFTAVASALPTSTSPTFGIEYVTINVSHTWDSDLTIVLQSPNGTQITLTAGNGGMGNDYITTVFRMDAVTSITAGSAPFNGSYIPEGDLGDFNNGENPNGTWLLGVQDGAAGDVGTVNSWSITFSATPAPPTATFCAITDCSNATNISTLPYSSVGQTTCGGCSAFTSSDACGSSFMSGNDLVYTYTPSADGWVSFEAQTAESMGGAENGAAIFLLDACPSNVAANCLASSTVQYPSNHGSPHVIFNLISGQTYYIVVSNNPSVYNGDPCINFDLIVSNIVQPNPTEEDCFGAQPICGSTITETNPGNGAGNYPSEINSSSSCLEGERNGKWYSFTAESTGTMTVLIQPNLDGIDGSGYGYDDYDFALYNTTAGGCEGVFDGTSPEVACNYEMVDGGSDTGVNSGISELDFEGTITVNIGETYMLYVSQWSVSTSGYTITLGGTSDYIDNVGPEIAYVDQPNCAQNEVVVHFSENIDCSSFASNGSNFTLTNPSGSSLTITGASSPICDAGGAFSDEVILTLSGNITVGGTYTIGLIAGSISDQCLHTTTGTSTGSFTIVTPTVIAGASDATICQGQTLSLNETGGTANTWSWSGPNSFSSTSQNPNISSATTAATGTYTVVGTITATACQASSSISATVSPLPTVTAGSNSPVCQGQSLNLTTTGNSTAWVWTSTTSYNPADIQNPTHANSQPAESGTYTVVGTIAATGCSATSNVAVTINTLPTVVANASANPVCEGSSVTLTGSGANTYSWNGGVTNGVGFIPALGTTNYSVTGTNTTTGCTNTDNIDINVNPIATVSAGSNASICANQSYTLNGSYGGGATSATWSGGTGTFSNTSSPTATYTPSAGDITAGSVILTYQTNDPAGPCGIVSDNMTLTINPMESAAFSYPTGTYCTTASDPTPTITGVGGGTFSAPAGLSINTSTGVIDVSASTVGGPYTVTYTTPGTCSSSSTFNITITSGADAQFTYATPICNSSANPFPSHTTGSNGVYSSSAGLNFVNTSTGEINLVTTTPGTYTITNTVDLGACGTDVKTFSITIDGSRQVFAGNDQILCESALSYGLVTATQGGVAGTITWSGGTGSFANANNINTNYLFGAGELGAVTLTVTTNDPVGACPAVSDQVILTIQDAAEVNAGSNAAICSGQTYTLAGTKSGATSNITWSTSGTGTFSNNTLLNAIYTPSAADRTAGTVTLTIASDDPAGACGVVTDNMVLTINPLPTVTAGSNSPVCEGTSLNLTTTGNATAWVWTGTGSYNPNDVQNPTQSAITLGATGTYTVVGTIVATGCSAQSTTNVTINPKPTVTAGSNSPICAGQTLNLTETGGNATAWVWTSSTTYNPDDIQNPVHTNALTTESGNYTVVGTIAATGCSATSVTSVTVNALPTVTANATDNTVCEGTQVTLTGGGANTYVWNPLVTNGVAFTPVLGTTNYTVTGTNTTTNCSNTANINVIVSPMPTASAGANDAICENDTYTLSGSFGGGASSATWSTSGNGTFDNAASLNAVYTPGSSDITAGSVTLTLTTNNPASDCGAVSDDMILTVNPLDDPSFSYDGGTFCITGTNPFPNSITTAGGTFSGSGGLVIDATTGEIDLVATGTGGPFTATYTTSGICPSSDTYSITITSGFNAEFSYVTPICNSDANPLPLHLGGGSNGLYSEVTGNVVFVNTGTGRINLAASIPGSYTITNTIAASGGCSEAQETFDITIDEAAEVEAGTDITVCESDLSYMLSNATIGGSTTSVTWTSTGDGTFDDNTAINPIYTFGTTDINSTIWLTVVTNDPGTTCGAVRDSLQLTINESAIVNANSNAAICAGQTYTLGGSLGGSTSGITWSTNGDGTFSNENNLTAIYTPGANDLINGTVDLTISSDNPAGPCSIVSDVMTLTINPLPVVTAGINSPLCVGQQLNLTESGGDATIWTWTGTGSYDPNDVQNPSQSSVLLSSAGTYTVTATIFGTGCSNSASVNLIVNPLPSVDAGVLLSPICANENIELTETGGDADDWSWTSVNGYASTDQNPTIFNATADTSGRYYVAGTISTTGCSSIDSVDVLVNPLPIVSYTVSDADTAICIGESITLTGTGTASSYTWNNSVNNGTAFSPTNTLTYQVIGEDGNGCKDSTTVEVVVYPLPPVFAGNDQNVPYGSTTVINDASPSGLNYSWTPADSLVDPTILNPQTLPLHVSNLFTLIGTDPVTGCSASDQMTINIIGGPLSVQVFANPNDSVCFGHPHMINALASGGGSTNYTYNWTSVPFGIYPDTLALILDTVSTTTTYYLEVVEGGVNFAYDTITVTILTQPIISSVAVQDLNCFADFSGSILINATGNDPLQYSINAGTTFVNDSLFANMAVGSGFITAVEDRFGCISYGDTVSIVQPTLLQVNIDNIVDASCGNNNGSVTVTVSGGTPNYSYLWDNSDTSNVSDSIAAGNYNLTVVDANSCQIIKPYTIANLGGGYLTLESTTGVMCYGDSTGSISVSMREGFPTFDFYISLNGNDVDSLIASNDSLFTVNNLPSNTYQIVAYEGAGCISNLNVTVATNPAINMSSTMTPLTCYNDGTGQLAIDVTGGTSPYNFSWSGPNGFTSTNEDLLLLDAGLYDLTITDNYLCKFYANSINVGQPNEPGLNIGVQNEWQCYGFNTGKITAVGEGGTQPYEYKWTNGTWTKYGYELDSLSSGSYHLILTDARGCFIADSNITLSQYDQILIEDSISYAGTRAEIEVTVIGGTPAYNYYWTDTELNQISTSSNASNLISGHYLITVTDFYGCQTSTFFTVKIPLIIPTLISPNADGYNDTWQIGDIESYGDIFIEIYNRWGNVIFTYSGSAYGDVSNQFDGTYDGAELPIGAYVYILDLKDGHEPYHGTLNIVRTR